MRFNKTAIKSIAATLVLGQLNLVLQPLYAAVREDKGASNPMVRAQVEQMQALQREIDTAKARKLQESMGPADQASQRLARVEELVRDIAFLDEPLQASTNAKQQDQVRAIGPNLKARLKPLTAEQKAQRHDRRQAVVGELKSLLSQQSQDQASVRAEFAQTRQMLQERKLPAEILARHDAAVAKFEQRVAQFNQSASKAQKGDEQALAELRSFFDQNPTKRKAAPVDPAKLPWRTPEPTKRLPAETQTAWFQNLYANKGTRLAQVGNSLEGLEFVTPPEPGVAPTAADLAETPETQRTAAIKAKALELGNNPVNIQNWVRNNVEWVPTWGAIQSAQDTLDKKRGNAIDIASLEIALLRAAKIPARYQFGTIELPAEQVMNWVGGVSKPEAAQQLLGQGGIANRGLIEGGKISKIRMEHAWVQAYVNWLPSRGAKQGSGTQHPSPQAQRNAWVPLDPSFKQYDNVQGAAVSANVPFNAAAAISATTQGAVLNEAEGWISGVNAAALTNVIDGYESALGAYINANEVHGSFGNVIGRKIIPFVQISLLSVTLPYSVIQLTSASPSVSPTLQHKFTYKLYASAYDKYEDVPFLEFSEKTTQLSGKRLSITYVPASQADADVINGYMPARHADGSGISPSEVPQSLPAYLIRLKAQLRVNGQVAAESSQIVSMGASLYSSGGFTRFDDISSWDLTSEDSNVAGQTTAIGLNMAGLSGAQVTELKDRMARTKAKLSSGDHAGLGVEEMAVDLLTTAIWSWFASADAHSRVVQKDGRMVEFTGLSYGLFHTIVNPLESWGVVRQAKFSGLNFDIGHVRYLGWSADNDKAGWVNFNKLRGRFMSALEHAVPERLFSDVASCNARGTTSPKPNLPACSEGISAVSAIAIAAKAGQKIFSINSTVYANNPGIVQQRLSAHSVETRAKIQAALDAGQEVLIHERPISKDGWVGAGYTVIDPETGAGGYLIEGGSNGAWWSGLFAGVSVGATIALIGLLVANALTGTGLALAAGLFGSVIVAVMAALILAIIINQILISYYTDDASASCFWGGFGLGNAAGGLVPGQSYVTAVINFIMAVVFSKGVSGDTYDSCSK